MPTILKVFSEDMPNIRLIGRCYTEKDGNEYGIFTHKWGEWFQNGYFEKLRVCEGIQGISDDFVGAMRMTATGMEYWIGILMNVNDTAPDGFTSVDIPAGKLAVCYVYGKDETGELFGMDVHRACMDAWKKQGWRVENTAWFIERYNCPRYTNPDEKGNVILDFCAYRAD